MLLETTKNTRYILTDCVRYIRSDVPNNLTDEEVDWLISNNICTIVDLREDEERQQKKCRLLEDNRFCYYCMPVTGGNMIPDSVEEVSKSYINMVDDNMFQIIDTIINAKTNVMYFCNAGKDRTGVVSAIILHKLGMNDDYIVEDYMKTKENLKDALESFARQCPQIDINVITPNERYMREFLQWLKYGQDNM
ncbi:MAG: tyrosine-protein phosphatase [Lachnospiraceae bacterium]|nr:tyrosine-protein phosphatase [Lachnospiraceae bacterium]